MTTINAGDPADTLLQLILTPPVYANGVPSGEAGWNYHVQIAAPNVAGSLWDAGLWDQAEWSQWTWIDLLDDGIGATLSIGSDVTSSGGFPTPQVGTMTLQASNYVNDRLSPWNAGAANQAMFKRGTPVRIALSQAGASTTYVNSDGYTILDKSWNSWQPVFTGIVDRWADLDVAGERTVTISCLGTTNLLANVNKAAQAPVGASDHFADRMPRLLADAGWAFGFSTSAFFDESSNAPFTLYQATTMQGDRLAEVQKTVISASDGIAFCGPDGMLQIENPYPIDFKSGIWRTAPPFGYGTCWRFTNDTTKSVTDIHWTISGTAEYIRGLELVNSGDSVLNYITATDAGQTVVSTDPTQFDQGAYAQSVAVFGVRPLQYTTNNVAMSNSTGYLVGNLFQTFNGIGTHLGFPLRTLQPGKIHLVNQRSVQRAAQLFDAVLFDFYGPDAATPVRMLCTITSITHRIAPMAGSVWWESDYGVFSSIVATGAVGTTP